jgi:hypothetical protein
MLRIIRILLPVMVGLTLIMPMFSCMGVQAPGRQLVIKLDKMPRLNEPVTLTCTRETSTYFKNDIGTVDNEFQKKVIKYPTEKIIVTIERIDTKTKQLFENIPLQDLLASGSLNWEAPMKGQTMQFSAIIKFPYESCWIISARSTYSPVDSSTIVIQVTESGSTIGCQEDYRPNTSYRSSKPDENFPIAALVDMVKPPRLNEPVQVMLNVSTIRDIAEASSEFRIYRMQGTDRVEVPLDKITVSGNLNWKGAIKKDKPFQLVGTVKFPEEGDWEFQAIIKDLVSKSYQHSGSVLFFHVGKDNSRWGWPVSHEKKIVGGPPLPPPVKLTP